MQSEQQYIDLFEQEKSTICEGSAKVLNALREASYKAFRENGFPSRKDENFRYTDIDALFAPNYGINLRRLPVTTDPYKAFKCFVPGLRSSFYFVVNDIFCPQEGRESALQEGVTVASFKDFEQAYPEILHNYYNRLAHDKDGICRLNTMFAQDGMVVYVKKNVRVEQPIQVVNMLHSAVEMMAMRRVLIVLEENAQLNILFCDHTDSNVGFLSTQIMEVFVGENACLDLTNIEETHRQNRLVSATFIEQKAHSRLTHNVVTLHNGTTRNSLEILLKGEGAESFVNGCAIIDKEQRADNNTFIKHEAGQCSSQELYKYVLNDASQGAFAGKVLVCKGAQKTSSNMRNQNLCATKGARMQTQPMLEIYADDVKCSHGATVGQLGDAALFYMQQRGIPLAEARRLLQIAFVREVIDNIRLVPLRERLQYLVEKRFRGELSKCEGCSLCL